ncbi:MAG: ribonuclease HII [archaeon]
MLVLGIDEAGRGPIIGPMVIAGVLIEDSENANLKNLGVKDSKQLTPNRRKFLFNEIKSLAEEVHFVEIPAHEIDSLRRRMSLNEAEAMKIAELIEKFKKRPDVIVIDLPDPSAEMFVRRIAKYSDVKEKIIAEHKADANWPAVSAASIIAKVVRDNAVESLEKKHGEIGSGYPGDERTVAFLKKHRGEELDFVRYSWSTAKRTIGKKSKKQSTLSDF